MHGIDYGRIGNTNRNTETGIRYGVIHQGEVLQAWADSSEADYGDPACPECGETVTDDTTGGDFYCEHCERAWYSEDCCSDEPLEFTLDDGKYVCSQGGGDCDIFIIRSPYFTYCNLCSPCAPGAGYLVQTVPPDPDNRAYSFGHDWFEDGKAPYPVYSVETGELVLPE